MSSNSPEAHDLLRLFKCVVDTGADVLVPFAVHKLLKSYNRNFERFLDDKKHEIFHLWQSKRLLCCECPPAGCNLKRTGHMDNWIFKKLYDDKGNEDGGHIVRNSGKVVQVCLHKYVTRTIGIDELDISALSFLLRNLATLLTNETTALDKITTYRSQICHAHSLNCYDMALLNTVWTGLENALVELTDPSYKRLTKKQIKCLRKVNLEREEIQELLKNVEENTEEVTKCLSYNNNVIAKCELNLKTTVVEESRVMQHRLAEESSSMQQAQQVVLQEVLSSKAAAQESGDKILEQIGMLNSNQASSNTEMSDHLKMIEKMLHQINGTTFSVKYEQSTDLSDGGEECLVLWQLATPENWNAEDVEQILTKSEEQFKDMPMKIKFVRKGSLVLMTTVCTKVLKDSTAFQSAVKAFLTRMVEVCNIDTHVSCNVDVTLHLLNSEELNVMYKLPNIPRDDKVVQTEEADDEHQTMNVMYKLPNIPRDDKVVQTEEADDEHQTRMKKHWNECEKFDVAFFNSDSQREIVWAQNVSKVLKEKYGITCAIPSKDYLYGFPLIKRLLQNFKKFEALILTVTEENHQQCQLYVGVMTSLIFVELNYISEIPKNWWKFPYINCSTCEHLWFPRLIDTLTTSLPDHFRRRMENCKDEQEENCEKCNSTAKTAVYHTVRIINDRKLRTHALVTLCGSLTDETWILKFLSQTTKFINILGWYKSLENDIIEETPSKVFVCVSQNVQKCPSIGGYVNSFGKDTTTMNLLKIAPAEIPRFLDHLPNMIDATTIDQKELAHKLFSSAAENTNLYVMHTFDNREIVLLWEKDADKWIKDNLRNINSLFTDISKNGFQEKKEHILNVTVLIIVQSSIITENSKTATFAKRFKCWPHSLTLILTDTYNRSEVANTNYRCVDGTCSYEDWGLKLKEEIEDRLIYGYELTLRSTTVTLFDMGMTIQFIGIGNDKLWIDEAILILHSHTFLPCPVVWEKFKYNGDARKKTIAVIFVPKNLQKGSYLHRKIKDEMRGNSIISVLRSSTASQPDMLSSSENLIYDSESWAFSLRKVIFQRIVYQTLMIQPGRDVLLIGSMKDFTIINSAVCRLQQASFEILRQEFINDASCSKGNVVVLFLSSVINQDFSLYKFCKNNASLITIVIVKTKLPVGLESTIRLNASTSENMWLQKLSNILEKKGDSVEEMESLHYIIDDYVDEIESLKKSNVGIEKCRSGRSDDLDDDIDSLKKKKKSMEEDVYGDDIERQKKANKSIEKDTSFDKNEFLSRYQFLESEDGSGQSGASYFDMVLVKMQLRMESVKMSERQQPANDKKSAQYQHRNNDVLKSIDEEQSYGRFNTNRQEELPNKTDTSYDMDNFDTFVVGFSCPQIM